jgi:mono/diheme cytochrome c family protein
MDRRTLTIGLGAALVVSIGLNVASWTARRPTRPNFEYAPDMAWSARYNAFAENPNFPDGMTLRAPVPGTIPRGLPPASELPTVNPFSADDKNAVARGEFVFITFCAPCHAVNALGVGLVVKHGFPPPPPLTRGQTQSKTDAELFEVVTKGINTMPPYALQLSPDDRWKAILHVRSFRRPSPSGGESNAK